MKQSNLNVAPKKESFNQTSLLLLFLVLSIYYLETIFRLITSKTFIEPSLWFAFSFGIIYALSIYLISLVIPKKVQKYLTFFFLFLITAIFISQFIYYKIFQTFYTIYSVTNSSQVFEFWKEVLLTVKDNWFGVLLLLFPIISFTFLQKKLVGFYQLHLKTTFLTIVISLAFYLLAIFGLRINPSGAISPYNLYYKIHLPQASVNNLGLLTYLRVDLQRYLTNWSEQLIDNPEEDMEEEPEPEVEVEYNVLDIDFKSLIENEKNQTIIDMHQYFAGVTPTAKNEFTGLYQDYNLIVLTAEAFSHLAVHPEITPTLYKMVHEGYYFPNFYTPSWGVSTSDGEYVANVGLIPKSDVWSFFRSSNNYLPFALGNQMKQLGYSTRAYHNHTYTYYYRHLSHPNLGYFYQGLGNGLNVRRTWPESDLEMMELTIPRYINDQPFHTYYMTVSGHLQYTYNGNAMSTKNRKYVKDLPLSEPAQAYLGAQIELDRALKYLLEKLEEANIADKTLIVLSADHYPYGLKLKHMEELAGHSIEKNFELYRNAFILYTPNMTPMTIEKPASSLDIMPTISNLMGLPFDSRLFMGRDLFSDSESLIIFENRSFITPRGRYNSKTNQFILNEGYEEGIASYKSN